MASVTVQASGKGGATSCACSSTNTTILDLIAGCLMVISAVISIFSGSGAAFQAFLVWGWGIFFSVTLIAFSLAMPSWILNNLPFMRSFLGRGLIISLGACLTSGWCHSFCFQMVVFLYCIILAVAYVIMDLALKMTPTQAPLAPGLGGDMTPPSVPSAPSGGNRLPPSSAPKLNYGPLPDGWTSSIDPKSGQVYYVHKSGVSQWTRP